MAEYLNRLVSEQHPDNDRIWIVHDPLRFMSDIVGLVEVRAGFHNDLSSVPRLPFFYWFYGGRSHYEGVIHDWLFRRDSVPCVPFMVANAVFLEAMSVRNKPWYIKYPMYAGVCTPIGYLSYHKKSVEWRI